MIRTASLALLASYFAAVKAQQVGTQVAEVHPALPIQRCTSSGCTTLATKIVLDSNWRWIHTTSGFTNCYTGAAWDTSICTNGATCASSCALEGANYASTYGITTSGNALTLKFVTGANIGSRVYLVAPDDTNYQMFKLKNAEFTFDVDMSGLPCGLNGALYLIQMDKDGGLSRFSGNKAGAKYGTGYCDAQCPHDIKFINGEGNVDGWSASPTDPNAGNGKYGTCCDEMDIWEANSLATAYTPHPCTPNSQYRCEGLECGDGADRYSSVCDKDGCDFNSWRMGNRNFLGPGKTIDTTKKITVVTQFITSDGTSTGPLSEIRRIYVQNGVVIQNSVNTHAGIPLTNSLTDAWCEAQKSVFNDNNAFKALGGMKGMGDAFDGDGMVLALSIWADHGAHMLWLDSEYPLDRDPALPGISRGPCATTSGVPADVVRDHPGATVIYSNIKYGDLGTTFSGTPQSSSSTSTTTTTTRPPTTTTTTTTTTSRPPTTTTTTTTSTTRPPTTTTTTTTSTTRPPSTTTTTTTSSPPGSVPHWGQCGGMYYTGPTTCEAPWSCVFSNPWYSQCL